MKKDVFEIIIGLALLAISGYTIINLPVATSITLKLWNIWLIGWGGFLLFNGLGVGKR